MSVKFEKESIRETGPSTALPRDLPRDLPNGTPRGGVEGARGQHERGFKHEIAHELGEKITGGESTQGYLAVCISKPYLDAFMMVLMLMFLSIDLPEPAPNKSPAHQDAHKRLPSCVARSCGLLHRSGQEQAWPLLQFAGAEDGCIRCARQRATWPLHDQDSSEAVLRPHEPEG